LKCSGYNLKENAVYQVIADHLWSYQHSRIGWDDYATKIDKDLRNTLRLVFSECRQNGFFGPKCVYRGGKKEIVFGQLVDRDRKVELPEAIRPDLCTLCESKQCYGIDRDGNPKQDKKNCWRKAK